MLLHGVRGTQSNTQGAFELLNEMYLHSDECLVFATAVMEDPTAREVTSGTRETVSLNFRKLMKYSDGCINQAEHSCRDDGGFKINIRRGILGSYKKHEKLNLITLIYVIGISRVAPLKNRRGNGRRDIILD